jgi:hypothetical protein
VRPWRHARHQSSSDAAATSRGVGGQQRDEIVGEEAQVPGLAGRPDRPRGFHGDLGVGPTPVVADEAVDGLQIPR